MQSHFQRTVVLEDWWLIKAKEEFEGKWVAVAGRAPVEQRVARLFTSAPIVKRYDSFTLETADGICVILQGFLNKEQTTESGFSSEVFNHFVFGFPRDWEKYAENCLRKECYSGDKSAGISCHTSKPSVPKCSVKNKLSSNENIEGECTATTDTSNISASMSCHSSKPSVSKRSVKNKLSSNEGTTRKRKFSSDERSSTNEGGNEDSVVSPKSITPKLSRSGRRLLPPQEFWRNQIPLYNKDGSLRGVQEDAPVVEQSGNGNKTSIQKRVLLCEER